MKDEDATMKIFWDLEFLLKEDSPELQVFFAELFKKMIRLLGRPFNTDVFDFGQEGYVEEIYEFMEYVSKLPELRKASSARGSQHGLYVNRTYFGLYTILNDLKSVVNISKPEWLTAEHLKLEIRN